MKKLLTILVASTLTAGLCAQVTADSASMHAGYSNQTWYSLENGVQGTQPKNNWDIAFQTTGRGFGIHINSVAGAEIYLHPETDTSLFANLDTVGFSSFVQYFNSDTSWDVGAFTGPATPGDDFDLGWGIYNMNFHRVIGDRMFIFKTVGGEMKKIFVKGLEGGSYIMRVANLDNSDDQDIPVAKSAFTGKTLGYYSFETNSIIDREPAAASWDLVFGQYTAFIPTPYTVTGVRQNEGVDAVKVYPVDPETYSDFGPHGFSAHRNIIGYNWKSYDLDAGEWVMEDSTVFFVKARNGAVWRMVFTGWGGAANGTSYFTKELISEVGINTVTEPTGFAIYPNPVTNGNVNLVFDLASDKKMNISLLDLSGKVLRQFSVNAGAGLQTQTVNVDGLEEGMYFISLDNGMARSTQKLIVGRR